MTTIESIPKELWSLIFAKLEKSDLAQCQQACQYWYSPARLTFLKNISLLDQPMLQQFIASIDYNPDTNYLNAVKRINITRTSSFQFALGIMPYIEKIFLRFSNLKEVHIDDYLVEYFTDEICNILLKHCPKLDRFELCTEHYGFGEYKRALLNTRLLVTTIELEELNDASTFGSNMMQLTTNFPRLQYIKSRSRELGRLKEFLPAFEQLSNLTSIHVNLTGDDDENFLENYLATKTEEEQKLILKRLSNVNEIGIGPSFNSCINSTKFITKHLTSLTSFIIFSESNNFWTPHQYQCFSNNILDLANRINSTITLEKLNYTILKRCLPTIMQKLFHQASNTRTFKLMIHDSTQQRTTVDLKLDIDKQRSEQYIKVDVWNISSLRTIVYYTLQQIELLYGLDVFAVTSTVAFGEYSPIENAREYLYLCDHMLARMPSVKQVVFIVPPVCIDISATHMVSEQYQCELVHPQVKELTLCAHKDVNIQNLLDRYALGFPGLKQLNLVGFYGNIHQRKPRVFGFDLSLGNYSLKTLTLDVTKIKRCLLHYRSKENFGFVIELSILGSGERYLYKISLGSLTVTRIDDKDLKHTRRRAYYLLRVSINSLEYFFIGVHNGRCKNKHTYRCNRKWNEYSSKYMDYITLFDKYCSENSSLPTVPVTECCIIN